MAQHDYIIANQSGAAFRSDVNAQLLALGTLQSGATQPSTTYAYQWWANTTDGLLYIRNGSNTDPWIVVGTLADTNLGLLSLAGGTLTGALLADDSGTAALPAIAFDGDPNTGIFRAGADQFGIATNGVERVEFGTTEVVFNDGGADVDFRIEGDTKPNLFKVDAGTDAVSVDGDFSVTGNLSGTIRRGTAVASTSGTAIDFTSIPSWVKRITILLDGVSTTGTSPIIAQIGDSGGVENTGYTSQAAGISTTIIDTTRAGTNTDGFRLAINVHAAGDLITGTISIANINSNTWIAQGLVIASATFPTMTIGSKSTSATLDRIRITTVGGTDTFDAGTVNILYEG